MFVKELYFYSREGRGPHEDVKIQVFQSLGRPQYKPYSFTRHHRRASLLKVCYSRYFFLRQVLSSTVYRAIRPQMAEHSSIWDIFQGNLRYAFQVSKYDMRLIFLKNCPLGGGSVISKLASPAQHNIYNETRYIGRNIREPAWRCCGVRHIVLCSLL